MAGRSPTRMTEAPNSRTAATAPATTTAGPWSPPMASTATFRLGPFDGDDLPTLVVAAVRADSVRQLDLAALRTERARRRGELVVRAALAPARLRVASFRQRHGGVSLARASRREVSEHGQPRVGRAIPASAGHHVPVAAADGAEAQTVLAAEWLHGERQRRLRFDQDVEVELVLLVELHVEVIGGELDVVRGGRARDHPHIHARGHARSEWLEAAAAHLGHSRADFAVGEHLQPVALDPEREAV